MVATIKSQMSDLTRAARRLRHAPVYACFVALVVSVGVAPLITTTLVIDAAFVRPPAVVGNPVGLRRLYSERAAVTSGAGARATPRIPFAVFAAVAADPSYTSRLAAYVRQDLILGTLTNAHTARSALVSAGFFRILALARPPALGVYPHMVPGEAAILLSHPYWRRVFNSDSSAVGQHVRVGDRIYSIAGVGAPDFTGVDEAPVDAWLPLADPPASVLAVDFRENWFSPNTSVLIRTQLGTPDSRVEQEINNVVEALGTFNARLTLNPLQERLGPRFSRERARIELLLVAAVLCWIAAWFNVLNIVFARLLAEARAIGIRLAIGASWRRISSEFIWETALIVISAGAVATTLSFVILGPLLRLVFPAMQWSAGAREVLRGVAILGALALMTSSAAAVALFVLRRRQANALMGSEFGSSSRAERRRRVMLIGTQASLASAVALGALAAATSLRHVRAIRTGMDLENVVFADLRATRFGGTQAAEDNASRALELSVPAVAGAREVAVASSIPFSFANASWFTMPGGVKPPITSTYLTRVSSTYFHAIGQRVVAGRSFDLQEDRTPSLSVIVNESFARQVWPTEDPLKQCFHVGGPKQPCLRVVGIAEDAIREILIGPPEPHVYVPLATDGPRVPIIALLALGERNGDLISAVRRTVRNAGGLEATSRVMRLSSLVEPHLRVWKTSAFTLSLLATVALLVTAAGIYAIVAFDFERRRKEIAIRMALGASSWRVIGSLFSTIAATLLASSAIGTLAVVGFSSFLSPLLYQTTAVSMASVLTVVLVLAVAALLATLVPMRRAVTVDVRSELVA